MIKGIDTSETQDIIDILEELSDQELAVKLLKEFNDRTKALGLLLMNKDKNISHEEWEKKCKDARFKVDEILHEIRGCK